MAQAISYIRFSAHHQGRGTSVERQQDMLNNWLADHPDVPLSSLSASDLGKSGYKGDHLKAGLGDILTAIDNGQIKSGDYLLLESIDRLGRLEPLRMFELIGGIVRAGITVVTLEDNQYYTEDRINKDAGALFILAGKAQQAHEYSTRLSRRISKANTLKRQAARDGDTVKMRTHYWLENDGQIIPDRGELVRLCVDQYLRGRGPRSILKDNVAQYPELAAIHPSTLMRWFKSVALIGNWDTKGEIIKGVFEALIDEVTFWKLQARLKASSKVMSPEQKYPLSGLVNCGCCGKRFYFRRKQYKESTIVYANCSSYLKRGNCTNNKTYSMSVLNHIFESTHIPYMVTLAKGEQQGQSLDEVVAINAEIEALTLQIGNLVQVLIAIPDQTETINKLALINSERAELEAKKARIELDIKASNAPIDWFEEGAVNFDDFVQYRESGIDEITRRDALSAAGYTITIDGPIASVESTHGAKVDRFELIRRSTRHNCYLLKHTDLSGDVFHYAVGNEGCIGEVEGSLDQLLALLTSQIAES
ncbi:MAG: recombinase family protein [Motiliproteus sp.]